MEPVATKRRRQPALPSAVFGDLTSPNRQPARRWLTLFDDEVEPTVIEVERPLRVVWSSLWTRRPDLQVAFDLIDVDGETDLRWTLFAQSPVPDSQLRHVCQRIGTLVNANLRYTYGQ
ncbi:hypothetical protein [Gordonia sp. (in: high G+C Gram-positive bacteria)]|uniref:hypothetical protein n=1 Tax=Gordonia sp. (in: high G+C Gram-positive bacteria) TaxID=84139 RepID=UPI0033412501